MNKAIILSLVLVFVLSACAGTSGSDPAVNAVQAQSGWSQGMTATVYTVPAGQRLVILHVSAMSTGDFKSAYMVTVGGEVLANHHLSVQPQADPSMPGVVDEMTVMYADPGTDVTFVGTTTPGNTGYVVITGYLVPLK